MKLIGLKNSTNILNVFGIKSCVSFVSSSIEIVYISLHCPVLPVACTGLRFIGGTFSLFVPLRVPGQDLLATNSSTHLIDGRGAPQH